MKSYQDYYLGRWLNWFSQGGHTVAGGSSDISISARIGEQNSKPNPSRYWRFLRWAVDNTFLPIEGPGHCERAYKLDIDENYGIKIKKRGNFIMMSVIAGVAVPVCLVLSILFWSWYGIKSLSLRLTT